MRTFLDRAGAGALQGLLEGLMRRYLVIGILENERFAREYVAESPQAAEDAAIAENPELIIAAVLNEEGQIVQ